MLLVPVQIWRIIKGMLGLLLGAVEHRREQLGKLHIETHLLGKQARVSKSAR